MEKLTQIPLRIYLFLLITITYSISNTYGQTGARFKAWIDQQNEFPIGAWSYAWKTNKPQSWFDTYADANLNMIQIDLSQLQYTKAAGLNAVLGTWDRYYLKNNLNKLRDAVALAKDPSNKILCLSVRFPKIIPFM